MQSSHENVYEFNPMKLMDDLLPVVKYKTLKFSNFASDRLDISDFFFEQRLSWRFIDHRSEVILIICE